ncbi:hypothetical protein CHUAL_002391 [Chamberlinius hualienensis]
MASYDEEHNCEPSPDSDIDPDHILALARLILQSRIGEGGEVDESIFLRFFGDSVPPPASKKAVSELKRRIVRGETGESCAICLKKYDEEDEVIEMPCKHEFHLECIMPWLSKSNSCPVCRHELPTDDAEYEEQRNRKKREKQRETDLENLHGSMFG